MKKIVQNEKLVFGNGTVTVQSMTNLPVTDVEATCSQIRRLCAEGCDIVRIAVPNSQSAVAFGEVRKVFPRLPLVADIHFDYRLALLAMDAGADKIRINPGNVEKRQLDEVIAAAKANNVIIRAGVNGGSVNKRHLEACQGDKCKALVASLEEYVRYFESKNFFNLVLSLKSSDVRETVALNKMAAKLGYPLHLGVTEAGLKQQGIVKNSIGIGALLLEGIGDTVRVSLTSDPVDEVVAANEILRALGLKSGVTFVSCPKCGRCSIDLEKVANEVYAFVKDLNVPVKIAVMGCEVNGPGECSDADLGIAGANGKFVFFKQGKKYCTVDADNGVELFKKEVQNFVENLPKPSIRVE
ncbi:MAG: flavodoxin-dependent (E)-4-hydroxy-3-methylbut-2-enyl-diphosphate synthase [Candidatus Fimimonas sp.]